MLRSIKNSLFGKFIRSKPYTDSHERKIAIWKDIKTIAFLLDGTDAIALRILLNRIYTYEDEGKKVSLFGYVKKSPPFKQEPIKWITQKDLNWIGIPKMSNIKSFIEKDFDVLINTAEKSIRPLEFVSTYSKANLRIGLFEEKKTYCYDFMIRQLPGETVDDYLTQVELYLKMMNS
ncbi:MAG: hypothetical protein H7Y00_04645 [Fimbriimonadaceae bacterium]|nr:hypothetical protein [Chitinophagales bacterium]